jgi:hypothetical protein
MTVSATTHSHSMAGMDMAGMDMSGTTATTAHAHKVEPKYPKAHDPRFMDLTVGTAADAKKMGKYTQAGGPGYGGRDGENVNNQKDKNEIIDKTDANHLPQYGVLPGQNYVQTIQSYTALSAIKDLNGMQGFPISEADWAKIVALQDNGGSPVLATVNYLTGLTNERPADLPADIAAKRDAVSSFELPGAGKSIADIVINPKDVSGNNIARSHHSADWFGKYRTAVADGIPASWAYALSFSDDGVSGSGRFNGFNNQDGNATGANNGEDAYFKMVAIASQQLGRPDLFFDMIAEGHNHTALDETVLTDPKINKLIGWQPSDDRTMSEERVEAIRQYYLRPDVLVNQGDFNRHVKTLPADLRSQLNFTGVGFKPEEQHNHTGGGGNNDAPAGPPTGAGTGEVTNFGTAAGGGAVTPIGSGAPLQLDLPGSPTIGSRPTLANLGEGGPFPVLDPTTGKLDRSLQEQLMTALIDSIRAVNDNPFLEEDAENAAFDDGAKKGVEYLKDNVAVDPDAVTALKGELADALKDGKLTDEERSSLAEKLNDAGMEDAAKAVEDGTASDEEIATLQEKVDGAASAKLEKDVSKAMEDGKLSADERKELEGRLGKEGLDALEKGIEDGTVDKDELKAISDGATADEKAKTEGSKDAEEGAKKATDGEAGDTDPKAASTDAKDGAGEVAKGKDGDGEKADGDSKSKTKTDGEGAKADGEKKSEGGDGEKKSEKSEEKAAA